MSINNECYTCSAFYSDVCCVNEEMTRELNVTAKEDAKSPTGRLILKKGVSSTAIVKFDGDTDEVLCVEVFNLKTGEYESCRISSLEIYLPVS